eukprot:m.57988 g.57988  ORF g.57988 m.57988 type:complete len:339 (+) comp11146_c0_seq1:2138-3154(+)
MASSGAAASMVESDGSASPDCFPVKNVKVKVNDTDDDENGQEGNVKENHNIHRIGGTVRACKVCKTTIPDQEDSTHNWDVHCAGKKHKANLRFQERRDSRASHRRDGRRGRRSRSRSPRRRRRSRSRSRERRHSRRSRSRSRSRSPRRSRSRSSSYAEELRKSKNVFQCVGCKGWFADAQERADHMRLCSSLMTPDEVEPAGVIRVDEKTGEQDVVPIIGEEEEKQLRLKEAPPLVPSDKIGLELKTVLENMKIQVTSSMQSEIGKVIADAYKLRYNVSVIPQQEKLVPGTTIKAKRNFYTPRDLDLVEECIVYRSGKVPHDKYIFAEYEPRVGSYFQ